MSKERLFSDPRRGCSPRGSYADMVTTEQRNERHNNIHNTSKASIIRKTSSTGHRHDTTSVGSSCGLGDGGATGSIATPKTTSGTPASSSPSSPHPSKPRIFPLPPGASWCSSSSTDGGTYAERCGFGIAITTATRTSAARWTGSSCSSGMTGASSATLPVPGAAADGGVEFGGLGRVPLPFRVRRLRGRRCAAPSSTARIRR